MNELAQESQPQKWFVPDRDVLLIKQWGDNAIVYHSKSGETHQLNDIGTAALLKIQQQPVSIEALANHINNYYEVENPGELTIRLQRLIKEFEMLGLIEPFSE